MEHFVFLFVDKEVKVQEVKRRHWDPLPSRDLEYYQGEKHRVGASWKTPNYWLSEKTR